MQGAQVLSRHGCRYCAAPLSVLRYVSHGHCEAIRCQQRALSEADRAATERDRERAQASAEAFLTRKSSPTLLVRGTRIVTVPANRHRLKASDPTRWAAFIEHLASVYAEAQRGSAQPEPPAMLDAPALQPVMQAGCTACRGACCQTAGTHAYLRVEKMRRILAKYPAATWESIHALCTAHRPERAMEESCVFHGARGCTLPRAIRGDLCNQYFCEPMLRIAKIHAASPAPHYTLVSMDNDRPIRSRAAEIAQPTPPQNSKPPAASGDCGRC